MKSKHKKYIRNNIGKKTAERIAKDLGISEGEITAFLLAESPARSPLQHAGSGIDTAQNTTSGKIKFAHILIISMLGFLIYSNILSGKFVWDDYVLVRNNGYVSDTSHLGEIFKGAISTNFISFTFYRPLQMLSYVMDFSIWGNNPAGFHLTNILLHVLVALALYWMVSVLLGDRLSAFLTAVLFTAHPIHTEAISYISGRSDPMGALFFLLAFLFYVKKIRTGKVLFLFLSLAAYASALLSRENSLFLIPVICLYHFIFREKMRQKDLAALLIITILYVILRVTVVHDLAAVLGLPSAKLYQRILGLFVAMANYARLFVLPLDLHMEYGSIIFHLDEPKVWIGFALIVSILFSAKKLWEKGDKPSLFALSWFILTLLPVSNIFPINAYMAEHWLYLPSVGIFLLTARGLSGLFRNRASRPAALIISSAAIAILALTTHAQNNYWMDPLSFIQRTLKYAPFSGRMYTNLGIELDGVGKKEEAIKAYEKAIELNPEYPLAYNNLAALYTGKGETRKAISLYNKALAINPRYFDAYFNLAISYGELNDYRNAILFYKKALEIKPYYATAHNNIAAAYYELGEYGLAVEHFDKAVELGFTPHESFYEILAPYRKKKE